MYLKTALNITLFILSLAFGISSMAETISSSKLFIKPTRITNRVVLVDNKENYIRVQALSVFEEGATDFSNTSKIILAISQLGEMSTVETSFDLGGSIGLASAKRVGPGIYQFTYIDANKGMNPQVRTIDARKAVSDIKDAKCEEFGTCEITTSISVK
jgi:hypothetical protein